MKLSEFLIKRTLFSLITIIGVTLIIFTFYYLNSPGSNFIVRYFEWWGSIFSGKWGNMQTSIYNGPVLHGIAIFLPNTVMLLVISGIFIFLIGIVLGFLSSKYKTLGMIIKTISFFFYSSPTFIVAIFLIVIFGIYLGLPYVGSVNPALLAGVNWYYNGVSYPTHILLIDALLHGSWNIAYDSFLHLILPSLSLILAFSAGLIVVMDASSREVMNKGYYKFLFLRNLPSWRRDAHLIKNASLQPINFFAYLIASLLSGDVLVEALFSYPGIGLLLVQSLQNGQYLAVLDLSLIFSLVFVVASFILDLVYVKLDPRAGI